MRNQRTDWVNLYFGWRVLLIVSKVLGAIGAGLVFLGYFIVDAINPALDRAYIEWVLGLAALAIPLLVLFGIFQVFRKPRTNAAIERELGWTPNPKPGESWFRADGSKKQYDHATGIWS
jgi:hypothetical protein